MPINRRDVFSLRTTHLRALSALSVDFDSEYWEEEFRRKIKREESRTIAMCDKWLVCFSLLERLMYVLQVPNAIAK
jgi:hypothetical protein